MTVAVRVGVSVAVAVIVTGRVAVGESAITTSGVGVSRSVAVGNRLMGVADAIAGWATVAGGCGLAGLTGTQADSARHTRQAQEAERRSHHITLDNPAHYNLTRRHSRWPDFLII